MTDEQAQRRLRLNYVVAELDVVLRELLADVPFITETTMRNKYRHLCGKTLSSELETVGMALYDLIEAKFADTFVAVRDSRLPGILRIKFVNQRALLAAHACGKDAGVQVKLDQAEPVAASVGSHDSAPADASVAAAEASDDGPLESKCGKKEESKARDEKAVDAPSLSASAARVVRKTRVLSYVDAAKLFNAAKIESENLEQTRRDLLQNCQGATDGIALSVFDFHALVKNKTTLTPAEYTQLKSSGSIACWRLSYGLKGLRAKCVHDPDRVFTIAQVFHVSPSKYDIVFDQSGVHVKNLFDAKYGATVDFLHMPYVVAVDSLDGRREFVPMECVQILLSPGVKKLVFVSILAARHANASTIRYGRS